MSNQEAMQQLTERFMNDADFREEMRQDPRARRSEKASAGRRG